MMPAIHAVFLANVRSLRAQIFRSFHSRWGVYCTLGIVFLGAAAMNLLLYSIFKNILTPKKVSTPAIFSEDAPVNAASLRNLVQTMALNFLLIGSMVSISFCMLMPIKSRIGLSAKVFGAKPTTVSIGEALANFAISSIAVIGLQAAFFWCLAERSPNARSTMTALIITSVIFTGATLTIKGIFQSFYERLLKFNSELSATLSILSVLLLLFAAFVSIANAGFKQSKPLLSSVLNFLWLGEPLPQSLLTLSTGLAFLLATLLLLIFSYRFQLGSSALYSFSRLLTGSASARIPRQFRNFLAREVLASFRHPTSQTSLVATLLLTIILAAATRANLIFPTITLYVCVFFRTAGAELSYGRTATTHWVYKSARYSITKVLAAKFCAVLITQGGLFLTIVFIAFSPWEALAALPRAVPLLFGLLCLSFFCGVLIPYSDTAPLSMLGAYALLLLLDAGVFYGEGKLTEYHEIFAVIFTLAVGTLALSLSVLIAAKDTAVAGQGQ